MGANASKSCSCFAFAHTLVALAVSRAKSWYSSWGIHSICSSSWESSRTLAASACESPPSSPHCFSSFLISSQVTAWKYSPDSTPITWDVSSPASLGASVSLSHSNKVMAVLMAMALSMYVFNLSYDFAIVMLLSASCPLLYCKRTLTESVPGRPRIYA